MSDNTSKIRGEMIATVRQFNSSGLSFGRSGNISVRTGNGFLITPSGMAYDELDADDLDELDSHGKVLSGKLKPSSEWHLHTAVYKARADVNAIVHVHSSWATGIACTRQPIPAFHYMVTTLGGDNIPCADYATFGTEALADNVVKTIGQQMACLMANHGQISVGPDLKTAFRFAGEVETLAKQYCISRMAGDPVLLDEAEMQVNIEKFKTYGKQC